MTGVTGPVDRRLRQIPRVEVLLFLTPIRRAGEFGTTTGPIFASRSRAGLFENRRARRLRSRPATRAVR